GIGGSLAVVAAMHSRTHRFEDPYAKTAKRVAVLPDEQRKTAKKETLDNKKQHTQDIVEPSSYSNQPRSKRSNIQKRSVDTSSSHTISKVHNSANEGRKICISEGSVAIAAAHHVTYNIFVDNYRNGERTKPRLNHYPLEFKGLECVFLISHYYH
nr:hypothetical protein [Tanacetum cinerariifolium]